MIGGWSLYFGAQLERKGTLLRIFELLRRFLASILLADLEVSEEMS